MTACFTKLAFMCDFISSDTSYTAKSLLLPFWVGSVLSNCNLDGRLSPLHPSQQRLPGWTFPELPIATDNFLRLQLLPSKQKAFTAGSMFFCLVLKNELEQHCHLIWHDQKAAKGSPITSYIHTWDNWRTLLGASYTITRSISGISIPYMHATTWSGITIITVMISLPSQKQWYK